MRHSPFSIAVKVVLNLSTRTALYVTHVPILSSITMYFRLLWHCRIPRLKLTAPTFLPSSSTATTTTTSSATGAVTMCGRSTTMENRNMAGGSTEMTNNNNNNNSSNNNSDNNNNEFYFDSFDIARYIDMHRHSKTPTLFPTAHLSAITTFNTHAQVLISHLRMGIVQRCREHLDIAERLYAPRWLRSSSSSSTSSTTSSSSGNTRRRWLLLPLPPLPLPALLTRPMLRIALALVEFKYAYESKHATEAHARAALSAVRAALAKHAGADLKYLVGGRLTYADIIVAQAISFDMERYPTAVKKVYEEKRLAHDFPDVVAWARAVRETHCTMAEPTKVIKLS